MVILSSLYCHKPVVETGFSGILNEILKIDLVLPNGIEHCDGKLVSEMRRFTIISYVNVI